MRVLIARHVPGWRRVPVVVLLWVAQMVVGLVVLVLRTVRAVATLTIDAAGAVEHRLAARTGRPALSQTGIAALAAALVTEFHAAYRGTPRETS